MDIPDDKNLIDETSDEKETEDVGSSGGGGGRRSTITVKRKYGTEQFPPDSKCDECSTRAVGVIVVEKTRENTVFKEVRPLCGRHRDSMQSKLPDWDNIEFRRFVDA